MQAVLVCSVLLQAASSFALAQDCHGGPDISTSLPRQTQCGKNLFHAATQLVCGKLREE
jgi:hypothetical protein